MLIWAIDYMEMGMRGCGGMAGGNGNGEYILILRLYRPCFLNFFCVCFFSFFLFEGPFFFFFFFGGDRLHTYVHYIYIYI